ncbi:MAG TPA: TOBE domain-containing protein, partial [Candidatus Binatia bacterium]|nr:TOBE domain-containing protein [Candidatus Binatia bacterium]
VTLAIRPEHVELAPADGGPLVGTIASKNYLGDAALVEVDVNGVTLLAKLPGDTDIAVGQKAAVVLRPERWRVFPE